MLTIPKAIGLLIVALALTLYVTPVCAEVGMGISIYKVEEEVLQGTTKSFPVARVYNTGNETLEVEVTVRLTSGSGVELMVEEPYITLEPDESRLIRVEADCSRAELGTYTFTVEVLPLSRWEGGSVMPGGTVDGKIIVVEKLSSTPLQSSEPIHSSKSEVSPKTVSTFDNPLITVLLGSGVSWSVFLAVYVLRRRKNDEEKGL